MSKTRREQNDVREDAALLGALLVNSTNCPDTAPAEFKAVWERVSKATGYYARTGGRKCKLGTRQYELYNRLGGVDFEIMFDNQTREAA